MKASCRTPTWTSRQSSNGKRPPCSRTSARTARASGGSTTRSWRSGADGRSVCSPPKRSCISTAMITPATCQACNGDSACRHSTPRLQALGHCIGRSIRKVKHGANDGPNRLENAEQGRPRVGFRTDELSFLLRLLASSHGSLLEAGIVGDASEHGNVAIDPHRQTVVSR
jgi:hypothetical protein